MQLRNALDLIQTIFVDPNITVGATWEGMEVIKITVDDGVSRAVITDANVESFIERIMQ